MQEFSRLYREAGPGGLPAEANAAGQQNPTAYEGDHEEHVTN